MTLPTSFDELTLQFGSHETRAEGMCAMEAAAWIAGEEHSDHPDCVDPIIASLMRTLNDSCDPVHRDAIIKPLIPLCLDTRAKHGTYDGSHDGFWDKAQRLQRTVGGMAQFATGTDGHLRDKDVDYDLFWGAIYPGHVAAARAAERDLYPETIRELCAEARRRLDREPTITIPTDFTTLQGMNA